jgi:isovaleryl-CoA dehydrogenase
MTPDDVADFPSDIREELLATVRAVTADKVAPRAAEIDAKHEFPQDIRRLWAELGLLGRSTCAST